LKRIVPKTIGMAFVKGNGLHILISSVALPQGICIPRRRKYEF